MSFLPNPHPVFVHFTIGLYLAGAMFSLAGWVFKKDSAKQAGAWATVTGAAVTVLTALTGWLAARGTPHASGEVHRLMERHETLGLTSLAVLLLAGAGHLWAARKTRPSWVPGSALIVSVIGAALLLVTGAAGGELVFTHGVGVKAVPVSSAHHHQGGEEESHPHDAAEMPPAAHEEGVPAPAHEEAPEAGHHKGEGEEEDHADEHDHSH